MHMVTNPDGVALAIARRALGFRERITEELKEKVEAEKEKLIPNRGLPVAMSAPWSRQIGEKESESLVIGRPALQELTTVSYCRLH